MIEINLLPGSVKRQKRKGVALPTGSFGGLKLPAVDRYLLIAIGMWVVGLGMIAYMQIGGSNRLNAATIQEQRLIADTVRLSSDIAAAAALTAKRDTLALKLNAVQELDAGRFRWAHLFNEIGFATPDYTWLTSILPGSGDGSELTFKIEGRMANAFALPKFIQDLEASPFIKNVELITSTPVVENGKTLYGFQVEGAWEEPPIDQIRTVPMFNPEMQPDSDLTSAANARKTVPPAAPAPAKPSGKE